MVKLIAITRGVGDVDKLMGEELISFIARVSNPSNQMNTETAPKLLGYLTKNKHWSPFEHVSFTLEIETSRAIAAQILRHRSFVFQELSQRYSEVSEFETYEARSQDLKNRQNSVDNMSEDDKEWFRIVQENVQFDCNNYYQEALRRGIAKEQARFLLPLSTKTRLYMTGNVRSWLHYIELRSANGTQKEHKDIACAAREIFSKEFPATAETMGWINKNLVDQG